MIRRFKQVDVFTRLLPPDRPYVARQGTALGRDGRVAVAVAVAGAERGRRG